MQYSLILVRLDSFVLLHMQFYMYFYFITSASDLSDAFLIFSSNKEIYKNK